MAGIFIFFGGFLPLLGVLIYFGYWLSKQE